MIANIEMARAWDGDEGDDWTDRAPSYEASTTRLAARLDLDGLTSPASRVLDIGCGTGKTTLDAARLASSGGAVGVDLSSRMLAYARERAQHEGVENVEFLQVDAQVHPFEAEGFNVAVSSFGAMFFNDPSAAFANIHRALSPGSPLRLLAWRPLEENEWLMAIRGALAMGRELPAPPPDGPGPFGLADPGRVHTILSGAGFGDIELTALDEPISFGADRQEAWDFVGGMGIVRGLTQELEEATKREALDRLQGLLASRETSDGVTLASAAWLITARRT